VHGSTVVTYPIHNTFFFFSEAECLTSVIFKVQSNKLADLAKHKIQAHPLPPGGSHGPMTVPTLW